MKRLLLYVFVCLMIIGFGLTAWKMFEFRGRLNDLTDNQVVESCMNYENGCILFFGDSQIALWPIRLCFGVMPIRNRGISGDWATKSVDRFERDVIAYKPKIVIIEVGTNDIGRGLDTERIIACKETMVKRAKTHDIDVILCSILPVRGEYISNHPTSAIMEMNKALSNLSRREGAVYVDLYSKLADKQGNFREEYTIDGLHPSLAGYEIMARELYPYLAKYI
jgi:lysophospholipase L1-like esterase